MATLSHRLRRSSRTATVRGVMPEPVVEIVGASFAGLACAEASAARGLTTIVRDRKPDAGAVVHTTGLLVKEVADAIDVPTSLTRRIAGIRLYAPSHRWVDLDDPGYAFLATDTAGVLRWFAERAGAAGATIAWGSSFRAERTGAFVVGADGPRSTVARAAGLGTNRAFLAGVEAELEPVDGLPERLHVFLDADLAPGYIGWVVPGVGVTQVGLACRRPARPDLDGFIASIADVIDLRGRRVLARRGGPIPVGGPVRPYGDASTILVGDAASLVSPLTGGGIHTALVSGRAAGIALASHLLDGGPPVVASLAGAYRRSVPKLLLRRAFDRRPPNALIDAVIGNPAFAGLARTIFFHHRGLLSPSAWRALARA
jgi:digeranylgeranylglycerophospholipid reductase